MTDTPKSFPSSVAWVLDQIDTFQRNNPAVSDSTFGWLSIGDSAMVGRLRKGGDFATRKMDQMIRFIQDPEKNRHKPKPRRK